MKLYMNPSFDIIEINDEDVISTSPGTETSTQDDNDGIWDFEIGS